MQRQVAQAEQAHRLLDKLQGIVIILTQGVPVEALVDIVELLNGRREFFRILEHICIIRQGILRVGIEDIGDQH